MAEKLHKKIIFCQIQCIIKHHVCQYLLQKCNTELRICNKINTGTGILLPYNNYFDIYQLLLGITEEIAPATLLIGIVWR